MILLGIDFGDSYIGVASTNVVSGLATPIGVYETAGRKAERKIIELVDTLPVDQIICGIPLHDDGREGLQAKKIRRFIKDRLSKRVSVPIVFFDEHGTSQEAAELIRTGREDHIAAVLILERYIATQKDIV